MCPLQLLSPKARKNNGSGLWLSIIVPILLFQTGHLTLHFEFLICLLMIILPFHGSGVYLRLSLIPLLSAFHAHYFANTISIRLLFIVSFMLCLLYNLLCLFPQTFTLGEAFLLSQLCATFILNQCNFLLPFIIVLIVERFMIDATLRNMFIASIAMLLSIILFWFQFCRIQLPIKLIPRHFYCIASTTNILLLFFWLGLLIFCISITITYKRENKQLVISERSTASTSLDTHSNKSERQLEQHSNLIFPAVDSQPINFHGSSIDDASEYTRFKLRKVFHLAAGLVYISGLIHAPQLLSYASAILLIIFWYFEWARRRGSKIVSKLLSDLVGPFRDQRDSGELLFTPIALLLGLSLPIWWPHFTNSTEILSVDNLCPKLTVRPYAWSGVLSIAIGDSFAALIGRAYGNTRWPYSHRTILGSSSSFIAQLIAWAIIAQYYKWSWLSGLIPILVGVLFEAYLEQIDNLVVPLLVMISFQYEMP